ncbi:MAG: hypothetical protein JXQ80_03710 [Bacteroidales bacterium]|nr:hypothetical protein [Bacteroidales bacterium]
MSATSDQQVVLISPLDWGLGHATRSIPVISHYLRMGYSIIIGGSGRSGKLLEQAFPELPFVAIPAAKINYPVHAFWLLPALILRLPMMFFTIIHEHQVLKRLIKRHHINTVISDNRYGLHNRHTHNIIITHQLAFRFRGLLRLAEYPLHFVIRLLVGKFDECWIPDFADPYHNFSGMLSHRYKLPVKTCFIGLLSRFTNVSEDFRNSRHQLYSMVVVLSGPEPRHSRLVAKIAEQASLLPYKTLIIAGMPEKMAVNEQASHPNLTIVPHLADIDFKKVLQQADVIICQAGYSSIMDLATIGCRAILIPTPNQPEQQYLAQYLSEKGWFSFVEEKALALDKAIAKEKETANRVRIPLFPSNECLPLLPLAQSKNNYHC